MIYFICFIFTPLFTYLAEKQFEKKNKKLGIFYSFIAILIPSLIAGFRAYNVGRDTVMYVVPTVNAAKSLSFNMYMKTINFEVGYKLFIYLITRFSSFPNVSLFFIQFVTILFVYLFAYKSRDKINMTFTMIIYMLLWYCVSFTFMRQSISMALILFSITLFQEKKYWRTLLTFLIAVSFHSAAIVSILIYGLLIFSNIRMSKNKKLILCFVFLLGLACSIVFFEEIVYFLTRIAHVLPDRYYYYVKTYIQEEKVSMGSELLLRIILLFSGFFYANFINKKESKINILLVMSFLAVDFSVFLLSYKIVNISRIGLYFFYPAAFYLIPNVNKAFGNKYNIRKFVSMGFVLIMLVYWIWKFPVSQWCETFPYHSDIITFLY